MPTYISLIRYTETGIKHIKDSPQRLEQARKVYESLGGKMQAFYLTMGRYDIVVVGEFPDDEAAAKLALAVGSQGNVRTETLRGFTEDEYRKIISELP